MRESSLDSDVQGQLCCSHQTSGTNRDAGLVPDAALQDGCSPPSKIFLFPRQGEVKDGEPQDQPPEGFNRQNRAVAVPVSQICETQG